MNGTPRRTWPAHGRTGGRYVPQDNDGFIVNELDDIPLQAEWAPLVEAATARVSTALGPELDGLYLRGSVAEARARAKTSDIDLIAIGAGDFPMPQELLDDIAYALACEHPIAREVVIDGLSLDDLRQSHRHRYLQVVLVAQSRHLIANDRRHEFPRCRPGPEMIFLAHRLETMHARFLASSPVQGGRDPRMRPQSMLRSCLRAGFELLEPSIGRFTRDIDLCCDVLIAAFPQHQATFERALELCLMPGAGGVEATISRFMDWYREEYTRRFPIEGAPT